MRRVAMGVVLLAALALCASSCGGSSSKKSKAAAGSPVNLTIWVGWSARELRVFKGVVDEYDRKHPDVTVKVVGGINDDKIVAAIRGGNAPDVVSSFNSYNVGSFCTSGAWIDLGPLMKQDNIDAGMFPAATQYYTQYNGKRCALPLLADTYGLYYNKALFRKAGITQPPKTITELTADAKKLTQPKPGGSFAVVGFDPFIGFYENVPERWAPAYGAQWTDSSGASPHSTDPAWAKLLKWERSLVDWYGYDKLVRFQAGLGDEFSASQAFETGKLAMNLDGEWRVAFIADEHPELDYGTAPLPVDDAHPELYGSGYINGTIIGIPKGSRHEDEAWALVRYLTTDDHALAELSNGLRNVPTTRSSLTSSEIQPDAHFATFLKIFANPKSSTSPITAAGVAYTNLVQSFVTKWQAGRVNDLSAGLSSLDHQIDAQLKQAKAGGVP
jgi:multiple sugar transport system substrate-binding protein